MVEKVTMPQLGESVTEGTITAWLKKPGDDVRLYEPLCEVNTDKVSAEIPATVSGTLVEIAVSEGATVAVGDTICSIRKEGASNERAQGELPAAESAGEVKASERVNDKKKRYSPAVLRLAQEHGIDLQMVKGSGRGGRITRKDMLAFISQQAAPPETDEQNRDRKAPEPASKMTKAPGDREIALSHVRRTIAERMTKSKQEAPHAWMMVEADVSKLVRLRERVKHEFAERDGLRLTYLPFFIKAVVEAVKRCPRMNATWAGDKIIQKNDINIAVAIAGEDTLYVPVIHRADQLSILGIAERLEELIRKTRANELTLTDLEGGTLTVNNTGSFGSIASAPIINPPQAAIISMESIVKRPVIVDDAIAIRDMVNFCLSLDHRVLDGALAGRFMQAVKEKMEDYNDNTPLY